MRSFIRKFRGVTPLVFASRGCSLLLLLLFLSSCTSTVQPVGPKAHNLFPPEQRGAESEKEKLQNLTVDELLERGNLHLSGGNIQLANLHFVMALKKKPESPEALVGLGNVYYHQGDREKAGEAFSKAIAEDSNSSPSALLGLAKIYREQGNYDAAVEHINKSLVLKPDDAEILTELAFTYDVMGQGQEILAEPLYLKVVALKPNSSSSHNNLGYNYLLQGRYAESIESLGRSLELDPTNQRARNNLATAYALNGNDKKALQVFESVLGKASGYNNIGYLYMTQGQWDKAEKAFKTALEMSPRFYVRAQQNLDRLQQLRNNHPQQ